MATSQTQTTRIISLCLTDDEAFYLQGLLQNDLTVCETTADEQVRREIFETLKKALE